MSIGDDRTRGGGNERNPYFKNMEKQKKKFRKTDGGTLENLQDLPRRIDRTKKGHLCAPKCPKLEVTSC